VRGFRPERGPTILTLVAVLAFCSLGVWQVRRHLWRSADLAEKSARIDLPPVALADAVMDPDGNAFRRAEVRGRFELSDTILVGPIERGHELGARVFTPLRIADRPDDAPRVLIDRGWIPQSETARFLPPESGESDVVVVHGLALPLALRDATPGSRERRRTYFPRFSPDRPSLVAKLNSQFPYTLAAVMMQSVEPESGGLPIGEAARPVSPVDHRGYALTWFSVGALALAAWIEYGRRRARELDGA
jgi:cytochrome oxidase assembly protein ShyY1